MSDVAKGATWIEQDEACLLCGLLQHSDDLVNLTGFLRSEVLQSFSASGYVLIEYDKPGNPFPFTVLGSHPIDDEDLTNSTAFRTLLSEGLAAFEATWEPAGADTPGILNSLDRENVLFVPCRNGGASLGALLFFDVQSTGITRCVIDGLGSSIAMILRYRHFERTHRLVLQNRLEDLENRERLFRQIAQLSPVGLFRANETGGFLYVNDAWSRLVGLSPAHLLGSRWIESIHPDDRDIVREDWLRAVAGRAPYRGQFRFCRPDDSVIWVLYQALPETEGGRAPGGYVGTVTDISDKQRIEMDLRQSEAILRQVIDLVPHMIFARSPDGRFLLANEAVARAYGSTVEAVSGADLRSLHHDEAQVTAHLHHDREALDSGMDQLNLRETFTDSDGNDRILETARLPFIFSEAVGSAVLGVCTDVTDLEKAEADRTRLVTAIEQAVESVLICDPVGRILYANPAFEEASGYERTRVVGKPVDLLRCEHEADMRKTTIGGGIWQGRTAYKKRSGERYTADVTVSPVFDSEGNVNNYVVVSRDVTREVELEERLRHAQKMEALGTLAGGIAHDFNNLLYAMRGFIELARDDVGAESTTGTCLGEALDAAKRATDLVSQILTFSRQSEQQRLPSRIQSIVREALRLVRGSLPATIEVRQDLDNDAPPVLADPSQIHQVLMNLCTNAYHAMREDGGVLSVTLRQRPNSPALQQDFPEIGEQDCVELIVSDTGHGMSDEIRARIFDPYFTTKKPGEGTGLGLSTVLGAVDSHSGAIKVESIPGSGSSFRVVLPVLDDTAARPEQQGRESAEPSGNETVMIIDDEHALVRLVSNWLKNLGYSVQGFTDSTEALSFFREHTGEIDIVITDQTMPRMTGLSLTKKLLELRPDLPIVLCTGYSESVDESAAKSVGVKEFLLKPMERRELSLALRRALDGTPA